MAETARSFITCLNKWDYPSIDRILSDDFQHVFLPASLGGLGKPQRNKDEFIEFLRGVQNSLQNFEFLPPLECVIDAAQGKVVLHLATDGKTKSGRPYRNEYVMIFTVEGDKIRSINEFVDSKYAIDVFNEEAARAALMARAEEACL